jgi:imidazolonepropionase-like amidohydrolase
MRVYPILCLCLAACATTHQGSKPSLLPYDLPPEAPTAALPTDSATVYIRGATVMTAAGAIYAPGYVVMHNGVIESVGPDELKVAPEGATTVEGKGLFVTPGIIDTHSHMGVYALPSSFSNDDGNEATAPTTPEVSAEHSFWPQDPALWRALASGVTTIQVLPGSANLIGGRSFIAHTLPKTSAREMRFPGALPGLKMACGENPKRVYGEERHMAPSTRMGSVAGYRAAFQKAVEYRRHWTKYDRDLADWRSQHGKEEGKVGVPDPPEPPDRNLGLETLSKVLDGSIVVQWHCYRADEMALMMDLSHEFGFHIRSFHHALEAYKIRDRLAKEGVAVSTWTDWGGFKMEAFDGVPQNAAMLSEAGVRVVIHSDSESEVRHLNQEAGKSVTAGKKVGIQIDDNEALRWVTANPAWVLGIDSSVGTLEKGKRADVVVWDHQPFSVYARALNVYVDGKLVFDRRNQPRPVSDFELGNNGDVR